MNSYEDPNDPGNSASYHTGIACITKGCDKPAGTAWSPLWCQSCNAERLNCLNAQFDEIGKMLEANDER